MIEHVVQQGEHVSQIANEYGFRDFRTIWENPSNADLRQLRDNPNVLFPGDIVHIPDKSQREDVAATGIVHLYSVKGQTLFLHLALKDFDNQPLADTDCELQIEGKSIQLTTDADGHIKTPISRTATEATLNFKDPLVPFDLTIPIKIGHLNPVEELSGQKARLSNLGYITRSLEDVDETIFSYTVQEFQCDLGLPVTGICDSATLAKLKELHGS